MQSVRSLAHLRAGVLLFALFCAADVLAQPEPLPRSDAWSDLWSLLVHLIEGLIHGGLVWILEHLGAVALGTAILIVSLFFVLIWAFIKFGPGALRWYWEHPGWAILVAFLLLLLFLLIVIVFALVAGPEIAVGILIVLDILLILLLLLALILLLVALARLLYEFWKWLRRILCPWVRQCLAWVAVAERLCAQWAVLQRQQCAREGLQRIRRCAQTAVRCVAWSQVAQRACGGWLGPLCVWFFTAVEWVCQAYGLVCIAWQIVTTVVCLLWITVIEVLCTVFVWSVKMSCILWAWILQC